MGAITSQYPGLQVFVSSYLLPQYLDLTFSQSIPFLSMIAVSGMRSHNTSAPNQGVDGHSSFQEYGFGYDQLNEQLQTLDPVHDEDNDPKPRRRTTIAVSSLLSPKASLIIRSVLVVARGRSDAVVILVTTLAVQHARLLAKIQENVDSTEYVIMRLTAID